MPVDRIGRFLRFSPMKPSRQALRGEMSCGSSPLPRLILSGTRRNRRRLVLPGMTGWAQVNGRNAITWETGSP
jgi:lipopolysaccharide/colanic/teichoic acid biosynthesis glycosyltransferase